ncbi:T-complex protein 1 subunit delta [Nosema bombycis CQ1]|uniref:T-complex protein 1 subunit delta n=1 Tax=Nosema bombycis (strain CQ1 / CVCC 102059) TaxID=578461 RepID=R0MRC6_NOSB1|nr:T-complex protein 1 subunit delta [Nosema bombycis CQ1]|eukprot:EOB15438.1 T-complex protein 1 subunit delta [Nosema bombycis CQ1]
MLHQEREIKIKNSIFESSHALLQIISTSLGPKGLDKMLIRDNKTTVTNDGSTILKFFIEHPIHKILSNVSNTQDEECGDGTTSVVVLICSLLDNLRDLLDSIHPSIICDHLEMVKNIALDYIEWAKVPISKENIFNSVVTSLNSKIANSSLEMAEASIKAMDLVKSKKEDIKIIKKVGGIVDDIKVYEGILYDIQENDMVWNNLGSGNLNSINTPTLNIKCLCIQFCLSPPKTSMDSKILIDKPELMEKVLLDERKYILDLCKKIKRTGCGLLLIQKSILRDSLSDLAKHFLKQMNILPLIIERKEIEFLSKKLNIKPISDIELIKDSKEIEIQKVDNFLLLKSPSSCTVLLRGCDDLVLDEADRSFNDALSVVNCLKNEPFLVPGGGSIEMGISLKIKECKEGILLVMRKISKAFEGVPYFLSKNAGLNSIETLSELKNKIQSHPSYGVSVRGPKISDMLESDNVVQPSKIAKSIVSLAIETVIYILKIDDILPSRK